MKCSSRADISQALGLSNDYEPVPGRWSAERAQEWYAQLPWLSGCNYYPATAINQIEMWQASSWDPKTIAKELSWARDLGFNTMRVYLHDLVFADDEQGLYQRMDEFLTICHDRGIRPFFVFFDDCHDPCSALGQQPLPIPAYHNSGWVTCPDRAKAMRFSDGSASAAEVQGLKDYVQKTIKRFANDDRVLMWELYNEPGRGVFLDDSEGQGDLGSDKFWDASALLVQASWEWAREVAPSQPICSNTYGCCGNINHSINVLNSDVHSLHTYCPGEHVAKELDEFEDQTRPIFMTEYMARTLGSTFESVMPILKERKVAAINWGFVLGKSGSHYDWDSRIRDGKFRAAKDLRAQGEVLQDGDPIPEPELWFHDILRGDGSAYDEQEVALIKRLNGVS